MPVQSDVPENHPPVSEPQRRGMRAAIISQCAGTPSNAVFDNGLILLYMTALLISPERILFLLSLFSLTASVLTLTCAYYADRAGNKRIGVPGILITLVAFAGIILAGFAPPYWATAALAVFLMLFSLGASMQAGGWFGLLHPLIPEHTRGRFLGKLRLMTRVSNLAATALTTFLLAKDSPVGVFQIILGLLAAGIILRLIFYRRIPELEASAPRQGGIISTLAGILRTPGYAPFLAYAFLLALFTRNAPVLFSLLEKEVLGFGDNLVVAMGFLMMLGAIAGFQIGGKAVDRFGTRSVFVICHFAFGLLFALFLLRDSVDLPMPSALTALLRPYVGASISPFTPVYLGLLHFLFGGVIAASGIAVTTEMLGLIPRENKAFASGICTSLLRLSVALSGMLCAWALDLGVLVPEWQLAGVKLSAYDSLLLLCGVMTVVLIVCLGLVPSVIGKPERFPGADE